MHPPYFSREVLPLPMTRFFKSTTAVADRSDRNTCSERTDNLSFKSHAPMVSAYTRYSDAATTEAAAADQGQQTTCSKVTV